MLNCYESSSETVGQNIYRALPQSSTPKARGADIPRCEFPPTQTIREFDRPVTKPLAHAVSSTRMAAHEVPPASHRTADSVRANDRPPADRLFPGSYRG